MQKFIFKIFLLSLLIINTTHAQIKYSIGINTGYLWSLSTFIKNKGNPSPTFKTYPQRSGGYMGFNIDFKYKKFVFETGVEYTEIGEGVGDFSGYDITAPQYGHYGGGLGFARPMFFVPFRIGYDIIDAKHFGVRLKTGFFTYARQTFGEDIFFYVKQRGYIFHGVSTIGLTHRSNNIQLGVDIILNLGKRKQHSFYIYPHYSQGLCDLSESIYKVQSFENTWYNYVRHKGSFYSVIGGYRYNFSLGKKKSK